MKTYKIPAPVLAAAAGLLNPFAPDLTPSGLVEAIQAHGALSAGTVSVKKPLTRQEAAALLSVSLNSVNRYIKQGRLKATKIGKRLVRIDPDSIRALLGNIEPEEA